MKYFLQELISNIACVFLVIVIEIIGVAILGTCYKAMGPLFGSLFIIIIIAIIVTLKDNGLFNKHKKF